MAYYKISAVIRKAQPQEKIPRISTEQVEKLKDASAIALSVIAGAGLVTLGAITPGIFIALEEYFRLRDRYRRKKLSRKDKQQKVLKTFYYLKQRGYINMKPAAGDFKISLTDKGFERMKEVNFDTLTIERPKNWDGKWWQVAADIPTKKYRRGADLLRQKLKDIGFFPLQRTLWFYPYDPRAEIEFVATTYGIERFVTVMEINRLDDDDEIKLKSYFIDEGILPESFRIVS